MDIINKDKTVVSVVNIDFGECFILEGFTYIKTDRLDRLNCTVDVVKLCDGSKETLPYECKVREVNATVIIGETPTTLMEKGLI